MADKKFEPRTGSPGKSNKYYRSKSNNGYNTAIKGNNSHGQRGKELDVLPNCTGWAVGRFSEIAEDTSFSLLKPVNAEDFIKYANKSLKIGQTPQVGACMVWEGKGSLAGHVAIVEIVHSDSKVITSESGWSSQKLWWNQKRSKGNDGNWGQNSNYKFLGFIYNPAPCCQPSNSNASTSTTTKSTTSTTPSKLTTTTPSSTKKEVKAKGVAKSKDTSLSGCYTTTTGLYLRDDAGTSNKALVLLPKETVVKNYGYYSENGNVKWMYVQTSHNGVDYCGFCSSTYLKKK